MHIRDTTITIVLLTALSVLLVAGWVATGVPARGLDGQQSEGAPSLAALMAMVPGSISDRGAAPVRWAQAQRVELASRPAAQPQLEDVVVYSDDMQNGRFDAFVPSGSGTYSIVDDGGGSLVARLTGTERLEMHLAAVSALTWQDYDLSLRLKQSGSGTAAFGFRWIPSIPWGPSASDRGYWLENSGEEWSLVREVRGVTATLQTVTHASPADEWYELRISVNTTPAGAQIEAFMNSTLVLSHTDPTPILFGGVQFRTEGSAAEIWLDDVEIVEHVDSRYTWSQTGGPEGGWVTAIAVDPRDWRVAYAAGYDGGVFKTTDGGATWTEIGLPNELWKVRMRTIELAPSNPDVVYVGVGGKHVSSLWRSDDGGGMWKWTGAENIDVEADTFGIAVHPTDPMHIFVSIASTLPGKSGVYESTNGGITLTTLNSGGGKIGPVEIDPGNPNYILAGSLSASSAGVSIVGSTNGGATWGASDTGMSGEDVSQILFYPPDATHVFAVTVEGPLYRSTDGGATWAPLESLPYATLLRYSPQQTPTLLAFRGDGLWASTNKGDTWSLITSSPCINDVAVAGLGTDNPDVIYSAVFGGQLTMSQDLGQTCTPSVAGLLVHDVFGIGVDPSTPAIVYAGTGRGLYQSTNHGETWNFVRSGRFSAIAIDPDDSNTVYAGATDSAQILKSTDGGRTWTDITGPITFPGTSTLVVDPNNTATVYAGTGHGPQGDGTGAGLYKSTNGGQTWTKVTAIPDVEVPAIAIYPGDSSRIAVATMGHGVYVSDDGGAMFVPRNNGFTTRPEGSIVYSLAMDPRDPDVMYAGTHAWYGKITPASPYDAVYKTTDGGLNWTVRLGNEALPNPQYPFVTVGGGIDAIEINPARPDEVYVALHDPGLVFTPNGGADWRWINHGIVPLLTHSYPYRMTISAGGEVLYATTCGRSIFKNRLTRPETPSATPTPTATATGSPPPTSTATPTSPPGAPTPTATVTPTPPGASCDNILPHGDFEAGLLPPWGMAGGTQITTAHAHGGTHSAHLGGADNVTDDLFARAELPPDATSINLSYWWFVESTDPDPDVDRLVVVVGEEGHEAVVETLTNSSPKDTWLQSTIDLGSYAGQFVGVIFHAETNGEDPTSFYLDDVEMQVCGAAVPGRRVYLPLVRK